jgi:flagellar hook-associated protein 3
VAVQPISTARISTAQSTELARRSIGRLNQSLLEAQTQLSTGKRLGKPSDDPSATAIVQQLKRTLERRESYAGNLRNAASHLSEVDSTLGGLSELLREAQTIASANVGSDVTPDARAAAAEIIQSIYRQAVSQGNRQFDDVFLFGGDQNNTPPFQDAPGGVQFVGSDRVLQNRFSDQTVLPFMVDGNEVFGALSAQVRGSVNLHPALTPLTLLSDLNSGAGIDQAGGLKITNGQASATLDISTAVTVEDLLNTINSAGANLLARINADGTGIDVLNTVQGSSMTISENTGTTAADLGIRSFSTASLLADLNNGQGVRTVAGADVQITRRDGTSFTVDMDGLATIADVIAAINAADAGGGLTAAFASANGIELTDSTGGGGPLSVANINSSTAGGDLGLIKSVAANVLTGDDVNGVRADGMFSNLAALRNGLVQSDPAAMTKAAERIAADLDRIIGIRGRVGAQVHEFESRTDELEDQNVAARAVLSSLEDADFNEAITRFQTLQTTLQASLLATARSADISLFDFLA